MPLDLTSDPIPTYAPRMTNAAAENSAAHNSSNQEKRKFLGIKFNCCGAYARIYVNRNGTAYEGRCPKCGKPVKLQIGEGGTDCRFFETQ